MKVGMTLPIMEPGLNADMLEKWSRTVDEGPYSSLAFGERMAFDNPDTIALLGATAAWTKRVRLVTTIIIAQLHDPVMLAKALATADMLSKGRLSVGLGLGGREEDYRAAGADLATKTNAEVAKRALIMKRVWAGEKVVETIEPVGPPPVQKGGPELLAGAQGPKSTRLAATWADGISGFTFDLNMQAQKEAFDLARSVFKEEGRPAPRLATAFWFAIGDNARPQVQKHLRHYMNWIDKAALEAMLPTVGFAGTATELKEVLKRIAELGADETVLIPTSDDIDQVKRAADIIG